MTNPKPSITVKVDVTNPGQFFACCGLLELADRLWPGAEGWFADLDTFKISAHHQLVSLSKICEAVIACPFLYLLPQEEQNRLDELNRKKSQLKKESKRLAKADEFRRKALNSKRIASGFQLGSPFNLSIDWWLVEGCDNDHLKTWAGQQAIAEIAEAIKNNLMTDSFDDIFEIERVILNSDGNSRAPLSFDPGRVGTAQDIGYSPDKAGQALTCCVWTELLTLIALQRFALAPNRNELFTYHLWHKPLEVSVAAPAARGTIQDVAACRGTFGLTARDSGNRYKAFQQATLSEWRSS